MISEASNRSHSVALLDEISPINAFLPKHAKDTTKPTCYLEAIDVTLVWRTETLASAKKRKRNPRKGLPATNENESRNVATQPTSQSVANTIGMFVRHRE
jgi:hypothetical protein